MTNEAIDFEFEEDQFSFDKSSIQTDDILMKRKKVEENRKLQADYENARAELRLAAEELNKLLFPSLIKFDIKASFQAFAAAVKDKKKFEELSKALSEFMPAFTRMVNDDRQNSKLIKEINEREVSEIIENLAQEIYGYNFTQVSRLSSFTYKGYTASSANVKDKIPLTSLTRYDGLVSNIQKLTQALGEPEIFPELRKSLGIESNTLLSAYLSSLNKAIRNFKISYDKAYKLDTRTKAEKAGGLDGDTRTAFEAAKDMDILVATKKAAGKVFQSAQSSAKAVYDFAAEKIGYGTTPTVTLQTNTTDNSQEYQVSTNINFNDLVAIDSPEFTRKVHMIYQDDFEYMMSFLKLECYQLVHNAQEYEQKYCALDFKKDKGESDCSNWKQQVETALRNCEYVFPMKSESVDPQISILMQNSLSHLAEVTESGITHVVAGQIIGKTEESDKLDLREVSSQITYNPLLGNAQLPQLAGGESVTNSFGNGRYLGAPNSFTSSNEDTIETQCIGDSCNEAIAA